MVRSEVADDPQVKAAEILMEFDHPRGGKMQQPRPSARLSETPATQRSCSPEVGEHTVQILSELGLSLEDMQDLAREGIIS